MPPKRTKRDDSDDEAYVPEADEEVPKRGGRASKKVTKSLNYESTAATVMTSSTKISESEQSIQDFSSLKLKKDHESRYGIFKMLHIMTSPQHHCIMYLFMAMS